MDAAVLNEVAKPLKELSEIGLGILGTLTTVGISIYFVVTLSPLLKELTASIKQSNKTNEAVSDQLRQIGIVLAGHDQRSINIEAEQRDLTHKAENIELGVTKLCGRNGI